LSEHETPKVKRFSQIKILLLLIRMNSLATSTQQALTPPTTKYHVYPNVPPTSLDSFTKSNPNPTRPSYSPSRPASPTKNRKHLLLMQKKKSNITSPSPSSYSSQSPDKIKTYSFGVGSNPTRTPTSTSRIKHQLCQMC